jgi:hypothetical protein
VNTGKAPQQEKGVPIRSHSPHPDSGIEGIEEKVRSEISNHQKQS